MKTFNNQHFGIIGVESIIIFRYLPPRLRRFAIGAGTNNYLSMFVESVTNKWHGLQIRSSGVTTDTKARLQITDGDIFIQNINKGIIMKSPDGNCWCGTMNNTG